MAVTRTRIVEPTPPAASAYVFAVAPETVPQFEPALSHRSHWYPYDVGVPDQLPVPAVSVCPSCTVPLITGSVLAWGGLREALANNRPRRELRVRLAALRRADFHAEARVAAGCAHLAPLQPGGRTRGAFAPRGSDEARAGVGRRAHRETTFDADWGVVVSAGESGLGDCRSDGGADCDSSQATRRCGDGGVHGNGLRLAITGRKGSPLSSCRSRG